MSALSCLLCRSYAARGERCPLCCPVALAPKPPAKNTAEARTRGLFDCIECGGSTAGMPLCEPCAEKRRAAYR